MLKAIVIALTLAVGMFTAPSAKSEKEIPLPMIVVASAAHAKPAPIVLVTKSAEVKPTVQAKKKTKKNTKKKIAKPDHHKSKASGHHKSRVQACAPQFADGLVKLHNIGNHDYGHIGPATFHLTAQPPCA